MWLYRVMDRAYPVLLCGMCFAKTNNMSCFPAVGFLVAWYAMNVRSDRGYSRERRGGI